MSVTRAKAALIVLLVCLIGVAYGFVSALQNQNPYESSTADAWHWQPSAIWLPSFILCRWPPNGVGIAHTRSGYLFRSDSDRRLYFAASSVVGVGLAAICAVGYLSWRRYARRVGYHGI